MFIDGPPGTPKKWFDCCLIHDMKYWVAGALKAQDKADRDLYSCVDEKAGHYWAKLIYLGVRSGHHSPIKNKYQWSWAWLPNKVDPYAKLTPEEFEYATDELRRLPFDQNIIDRALSEIIAE